MGSRAKNAALEMTEEPEQAANDEVMKKKEDAMNDRSEESDSETEQQCLSIIKNLFILVLMKYFRIRDFH